MSGYRLPHFGIRKREAEARRHDADHRIRSVVHPEISSQSLLGSSELLLPEAVAQNGQTIPPVFFLSSEYTSEQRFHAATVGQKSADTRAERILSGASPVCNRNVWPIYAVMLSKL